MGKKKFLTGAFLFFISKANVFAVDIDNFTEPDPGDIGLTISTELRTLLNGSNAEEQVNISRTFASEEENTYKIEDNVLKYSGKQSLNLTYSSSNGFFNFAGNPIFRLHFAENPIFNAENKILINTTLTDTSDEVRIGKLPIDQKLIEFDINTFSRPVPDSSPADSPEAPAENPFDFTKIKSLQFTFNSSNLTNGEDPVEFTVNNIEAVPEPFSMVTLGTGIAAFIRKRRKSNY